MIDNLTRFIAYICPNCSGITDGFVNVFKFSGDKSLNLICDDKTCNGNSGAILMKGDKVKIIIHCPVCAETHTYTISTNAFWSKELITFNCVNSGITVFFAGKKDKVIKAVNEYENNFDIFEEDPELFTEELQITFQTLDLIHCLIDDRRMICNCGSRNLTPSFDNDTMYIECEQCGKKTPVKPSSKLLDLLMRTDGDFTL